MNWIELQYQYECFFFVADWHALTTDYEDTSRLPDHIHKMLIDWLAAGINPGVATVFCSHVPGTRVTSLSMITPLGWRPARTSGAAQGEGSRDLRLPRLSAAAVGNVLIYRPPSCRSAGPVAHVEITREIARRFSHIYGGEPDFEAKAEGGEEPRRAHGDNTASCGASSTGRQPSGTRRPARFSGNNRITVADRERLLGWLEGSGVAVLRAAGALTKSPVRARRAQDVEVVGNTIGLREDPDSVAKKLKTMQTDPARVRRTDPGDPDKCPVFDLHKIFSDAATIAWAAHGCRTASIGCLECKKPLIDKVVEFVNGMRKRAQEYEENPDLVRTILVEGAEKAREAARDTMDEVRRVMHLRADL